MTAFPNVFYTPTGVPYPFGIGAAGIMKYLDTDLTLTGSLANLFTFPTELNVRYDIEAVLVVNLSGAGIVTTSLGVTGLTPTMRQEQLAEATAATALKTAAGTGDQVIASGSISTGVHSLIVRGSLGFTSAGATCFLAVSTGGTGLVAAGSTFRVFRSES